MRQQSGRIQNNYTRENRLVPQQVGEASLIGLNCLAFTECFLEG